VVSVVLVVEVLIGVVVVVLEVGFVAGVGVTMVGFVANVAAVCFKGVVNSSGSSVRINVLRMNKWLGASLVFGL
jgi:hypothetical protein